MAGGQHDRPSRGEAERIQRAADRERATPHTLLALDRFDDALGLFFEGFRREYLHSIASEKRSAAWAAAAHATIDLVVTHQMRVAA